MNSTFARSRQQLAAFRPQCFSTLFSAVILIAFLVTPITQVSAQDATSNDQTKKGTSSPGAYLAATSYRDDNDAERSAQYYRSGLAHDPNNPILLEQSFLMEAMSGNWPQALLNAKRLVKIREKHRTARMLLGISEFNAKNYTKALEHFKLGAQGPIGELTSAIASAWIHVATSNTKKAFKALNVADQPDWAEYYLLYHRALVADIAGNRKIAATAYSRVYEKASKVLRTNLAYTRHAARSGNLKLARQLLDKRIRASGNNAHPLVLALLKEINDKKKIELIVQNVRGGLAEVFYGLGDAVVGEGGVGIGLLYLQLALYLEPQHPFALAALANAYESTKRYEKAIDTYTRIPDGTPLQLSIDIRKAYNYNSLERVDEAENLLLKLSKQYKEDIRPLDALGNIMRARKRYKEAVTYYNQAIDLINEPKLSDWTFFYSRGTCFERLKQWDKAEKDLKKALELAPNQPLVLNYLGYSWIDQNLNQKEALAMIEKAVKLKPDDGYIVDSLGWAHYKLGNLDEAAKHLQRAVELRPSDPLLNDHLGDVMERLGKKIRARQHWTWALHFGADEENAKKIRVKLAKLGPLERNILAMPRKSSTGKPIAKSRSEKSKPVSTSGIDLEIELEFWNSVKSTNDPSLLQLYLDKYPRGTFAELAKTLIARHRGEK